MLKMLYSYFFSASIIITSTINTSNLIMPEKQGFRNSISQAKITKEDIYGNWVTWAKTSNQYRSNPYLGKKNSYSFKEDSSIVIIKNNKRMEGSWALSDKSEITIVTDGKTQIYRITQFKDNSMILMDSNSYLSLKKYH
ncbi:hypothetical protein [Maribacter sp. 2304DJ31-5]|uniref:hypothetical protein n=1 Tax=Maribacter sp. 2304DJ31-5 TaxID=3386273 RepID=UPI0039BC644E